MAVHRKKLLESTYLNIQPYQLDLWHRTQERTEISISKISKDCSASKDFPQSKFSETLHTYDVTMKTNQSLRTTYWISPTLSQNLKTCIIYQITPLLSCRISYSLGHRQLNTNRISDSTPHRTRHDLNSWNETYHNNVLNYTGREQQQNHNFTYPRLLHFNSWMSMSQ